MVVLVLIFPLDVITRITGSIDVLTRNHSISKAVRRQTLVQNFGPLQVREQSNTMLDDSLIFEHTDNNDPTSNHPTAD